MCDRHAIQNEVKAHVRSSHDCPCACAEIKSVNRQNCQPFLTEGRQRAADHICSLVSHSERVCMWVGRMGMGGGRVLSLHMYEGRLRKRVLYVQYVGLSRLSSSCEAAVVSELTTCAHCAALSSPPPPHPVSDALI